jgi:hypothetical protein
MEDVFDIVTGKMRLINNLSRIGMTSSCHSTMWGLEVVAKSIEWKLSEISVHLILCHFVGFGCGVWRSSALHPKPRNFHQRW